MSRPDLAISRRSDVGASRRRGHPLLWMVSLRRAAVTVILVACMALLQPGAAARAAVAVPATPGQPITAAFTTPGTARDYTLAATSGQKIAVSVTAAQLTSTFGTFVNVTLVRPDGTDFGSIGDLSGPDLFTAVTDTTGTWTVRFTPLYDTTGTITFTITKPSDKVVAVTPGKPVTVSYPGGGRDIRLTVYARAGQQLTFTGITRDLRSASGTGDPYANYRVIRPDGTPDVYVGLNSPGFSEKEAPLSVTGTWTLLMAPHGDTVGTERLTVGVVSNTSRSLTVGTPVDLSTTTPGQNVNLDVRGVAGQALVVTLTGQELTMGSTSGHSERGIAGVSFTGPGVSDGTLLQVDQSFAELSFPQSGTYRLVYNPYGDTTGTATLTVRRQLTTTTVLTLGNPASANIAAGDRADFRFAGVHGRRVTVLATTTADSLGGADLIVLRPGGSEFGRTSMGGGTSIFLTFDELPVDGTWTLRVDPIGQSAVPVTITAGQPIDQTSPIVLGQQVTATVSVSGQRIRYTFPGTAGRRVAVDTVSQNWVSPVEGLSFGGTLKLVAPDGRRIDSLPFEQSYPGCCNPTTWTDFPVLDSTGTWTLEIGGRFASTGSRTFALRQLEDLTGHLTLGQTKTVTIPSKGAQSSFTFRWNGQGGLTWAATASTFGGSVVLLAPDGRSVSSGAIDPGDSSGYFSGDGSSGVWTVRFSPNIGQTGSLRFTLAALP